MISNFSKIAILLILILKEILLLRLFSPKVFKADNNEFVGDDSSRTDEMIKNSDK